MVWGWFVWMEIMYILRGGGSSFVDDVLMGLSSLTAFHLRPFPGGVKKVRTSGKGAQKSLKTSRYVGSHTKVFRQASHDVKHRAAH